VFVLVELDICVVIMTDKVSDGLGDALTHTQVRDVRDRFAVGSSVLYARSRVRRGPRDDVTSAARRSAGRMYPAGLPGPAMHPCRARACGTAAQRLERGTHSPAPVKSLLNTKAKKVPQKSLARAPAAPVSAVPGVPMMCEIRVLWPLRGPFCSLSLWAPETRGADPSA
jgi:hypothetical protein